MNVILENTLKYFFPKVTLELRVKIALYLHLHALHHAEHKPELAFRSGFEEFDIPRTQTECFANEPEVRCDSFRKRQ